jgi:hypothetical protein
MVSAALMAQNNKAVSTPAIDATLIVAAYKIIAPCCGSMMAPLQEQLSYASANKEA